MEAENGSDVTTNQEMAAATRAFRGNQYLAFGSVIFISDFWPLELGKIVFYCLKPPSL